MKFGPCTSSKTLWKSTLCFGLLLRPPCLFSGTTTNRTCKSVGVTLGALLYCRAKAQLGAQVPLARKTKMEMMVAQTKQVEADAVDAVAEADGMEAVTEAAGEADAQHDVAAEALAVVRPAAMARGQHARRPAPVLRLAERRRSRIPSKALRLTPYASITRDSSVLVRL
jgi:hypothetical protein